MESSAVTMGRFWILCMPRIPDWGGLRMGVDNSEPKTPPLVMVKVPPCRSSSASFPSRARRPKSAMLFSMSAKLSASASRTTGTTRPWGEPTATPMS